MLIVDFLRHGALQGGVKYRGRIEGELTPEGKLQMQTVWQHIQGDVDVIISSPLLRCASMAQAWASENNIDCVIDERLAEMHYGEWEGLSHDEIEAAFPGMLKQWRHDPSGMRPPSGESPEELETRICEFWQDLTQTYRHKHILLIGHSGSTRMLIAHILQKPIAYTRQIDMPYACWSRAEHQAGKNRMLFVNGSI